jgi:acyl carrier protein
VDLIEGTLSVLPEERQMGQDSTSPADSVPSGIPRGIEVLVKKASVDAAFRSLLLERREEAAARIALKLDAAERLMLRAVPREQLEAIIARTTVPQEHRRAFLGQVAGAMLAVVGLAAGGVRAGAYDGVWGLGGFAGPLPPGPNDDAKKAKPAGNAERVIGVIADQLKIDSEGVTPEKSLVKDLGAKPMQMPRLRTALAKEFGVRISASTFGHVHTVGDAIACVEKALAKQSPPTKPSSSPGPPGTFGMRPEGWSGGMRP